MLPLIHMNFSELYPVVDAAQPQILDITQLLPTPELEGLNLQVMDALVTVLHHRDPIYLHTFLNPAVHSVWFCFMNLILPDLLIERIGTRALIGYGDGSQRRRAFELRGDERLQIWEHLVVWVGVRFWRRPADLAVEIYENRRSEDEVTFGMS